MSHKHVLVNIIVLGQKLGIRAAYRQTLNWPHLSPAGFSVEVEELQGQKENSDLKNMQEKGWYQKDYSAVLFLG